MRTATKLVLAFGALAAGTLAAEPAFALSDVDAPLPNVLLLIDTSGSMENMADGKRPADSAATACSPGTNTPQNRWAQLLSVMTGTIQNFSCYAHDRSSASFINEFTVGGVQPYDKNYYLPFHRVLSNGCTTGPGATSPTWYGWPAGAIKYHDWSEANVPCSGAGFQQANDGILDTFRDRVRFGLMTFDTFPDAGTGAAGTAPDANTGMKGMWSYFLNWNSGGTPASGNPPNCASTVFEVGARNPAAPPWEGRLINFGLPDAPLESIIQNNDRIQEALLAMRPYGATPIAGLMADARTFLLYDNSIDPATGKPFGPASDPYFAQCGTRKTYIILLSDGEPNQDLRDTCATGNGVCPYKKPHEYAYELATLSNPKQRIKTFTVGFGLSDATYNGQPVNCKTLSAFDIVNPGGKCANAQGSLKACCTLARIAYEGDTSVPHCTDAKSCGAYFVDNVGELKLALSQVLQAIASSTSRTYPVFSTAVGAPGAQGNAPAASYQFVTSFETGAGGTPWTGNLERKRYKCETINGVFKAYLQNIDGSKGDDFEANLNTKSPARSLFTYIGTGSTPFSKRSIRPTVGTDDGLGTYSGNDTGLLNGPNFATKLASSAKALEIDSPLPSTCSKQLNTTSPSICAERVVRWHVGENNAGIPETRDPASCPQGQTCSLLGAIYHSTPTVVGPPDELLRDESYSVFAAANAKRPTVAYTATTDGQLHAFKVASNDVLDSKKVDTKENNELWSFFPPYVLPGLVTTYNQQAVLLDGAPVVRDVVGKCNPTCVYERTATQAKSADPSGYAGWRTVLLAGGGAGGGFYYALDVTDPKAPKFLWQLSTDSSGVPLFGSSVPTPAIATIALKDGLEVKEVPVAILPGGSSPLLPGTCPRKQTSWPKIEAAFPPRTSVRCWGTGAPPSHVTGPGRSITIARLDNGKIIMNLRRDAADGPTLKLGTNRKDGIPFDSPLTGIPIPYPAQTGQIANRVYIGDADGTLWRINLADPDPTKWSVEIAWDAYSHSSDSALGGQPIQTPPVLSVDPIGNLVMLFSTGDQEVFTNSAGVKTRIWSITEEPGFKTKSNWVIPFENGMRVTGPISLFNSVAYFSTFNPAVANICSDGDSWVWGVDYRQKANGTGTSPEAGWPLAVNTFNRYPKRAFPIDANNPSNLAYTKTFPEAIVFGVSVTQTPTCTETTNTNDPYFGQHTAVSKAAAGEFQLVFQTGPKAGSQAQGAKTNTITQALPAPRLSTRVDSWASIVE